MRKFFLRGRFGTACLGLLTAALLFAHSEAKAAQLNGSLALAGFGVSENGPTVGTSTQFTASFYATSGAGFGDYAPIPLLTSFGSATLDLASFATFALSNATYGSFATTSGSVVQHNANFLDVLLLGVYSPGPGLPGFDPTPASLRISINQSGESIAAAATLNSPPVPEPGTLLLLGSGLVGLVVSRRRLASR
jgi:hypothetical protein